MKRCHTIEPFVQSRAHNKKKVTGFHTEGEGPWNFPPPATIPPPPPPEILKLCMVIILAIYMLLNISMCHQNVVWKFCPRLRQKQSERM